MSARIDFMPMSLLSENRTEYYQFSIRNYVFVREERINFKLRHKCAFITFTLCLTQ